MARSIPNDLVRQQGEAVLKALGHIGPAAAEFKYDARDGQYKYIETNFRYTMRNGLGGQAGVDIAAIRYHHVLGNTRALRNISSTQSPVHQHQVMALLEWFNIVDHKPRLKHIRSAIRCSFPIGRGVYFNGGTRCLSCIISYPEWIIAKNINVDLLNRNL